MPTKETSVRQAAERLHAAITDARAAGLSVTWPRTADGLTSIAISETARAASTAPIAPAKPRRANQKVTK